MANICDNELHVYSERPENLETIKNFFKGWLDSGVNYEEDENLEIYFPSPWEFPEEEMDKLAKSLPYPDEITGDCLSTEWGCRYTEFHTLENGKWSK